MVNDRSTLLGPDGQPLSTLPPIVVIKTRQPLPQKLVQAISATTKSIALRERPVNGQASYGGHRGYSRSHPQGTKDWESGGATQELRKEEIRIYQR